jgi:hypothetical protein
VAESLRSKISALLNSTGLDDHRFLVAASDSALVGDYFPKSVQPLSHKQRYRGWAIQDQTDPLGGGADAKLAHEFLHLHRDRGRLACGVYGCAARSGGRFDVQP